MIELFNDIYIEREDYQWIVKQKKIITSGKKKGEETEVCISYHPRLSWALESARDSLAKRKFKEERLTLKESMDYLKELTDRLIECVERCNNND